jgi:hypothetical protein
MNRCRQPGARSPTGMRPTTAVRATLTDMDHGGEGVVLQTRGAYAAHAPSTAANDMTPGASARHRGFEGREACGWTR